MEPLAHIIAAAGVNRIDTMKIDIEGFEDRALMPFIATAPRSLWPRQSWRPSIARVGAPTASKPYCRSVTVRPGVVDTISHWNGDQACGPMRVASSSAMHQLA
jgi:hypothetical protein